jgi:oxygen-dependent protoporphyrinogen oxidase
VVVVGGGISGLAAAWRVCRDRHDLHVTVLESADRVGGLLRVSEVEGLALDEGAESVLATRPEAVRLIREVGLSDDLVHPTEQRPRLLVGGELMDLPSGLVMGVPTDLENLARSGVLSPQALARIPLDHVLPPTRYDEDISLGELVGRRLGPQVAERLVSPLTLGVYADRAVNISMRAAAPSLFEAMRGERSLLAAARRARREPSLVDGRPAPVFAGIRGGIGRLPGEVAARLREAGAEIRTGTRVLDVRRRSQGWDIVVAGADGEAVIAADAVVLAVPAPVAADLMRGLSVQAEAELSEIGTTSVAVTTLVYRAADLPGGALPDGSGYLVPPTEGRPVKAATFSSQKWGWVADAGAADRLVAVRASLGHADDSTILERDDEEIARTAADDVAFVARLGRARPVATRVTRWDDGLPRYAVGHVDRIERITEAAHSLPGLALAGSAYEGVGIAACIARASAAGAWIAGRLGHGGQWRHG